MIFRRVGLSVALFALLAASLGGVASVRAFAPANTPFARTWARTDEPVVGGAASRTWMWGPEALTGLMVEPYAEGLYGERTVQYYDKARMEITDPTAIDDGIWYVTNGLLVRELVSGMQQEGNDTFVPREPANVNVAGDFDDPNGPTYETIGLLLNQPPLAEDAVITQRLARNGTVSNDPTLASYAVEATELVSVPNIEHRIAEPFWEFMNATGVIFEDGALQSGALFPNPYYATGYPIAEAYWVNVLVGGTAQDVLLQCFERRCLTYTPGNEPGWQVEAGNVGLHYFVWRYVQAPLPAEAERDIAFVSERSGDAEIYLVGEDGKGLRNLADHPARDYGVSWAPDGRMLAFVSDRDGDDDIWVMDADGANPRNLTSGHGGGNAPAWSPDGRSIAFTSFRDGNSEIYVMDADGSDQRNLTNHDSGDYSPVWSPDSTRIAFTSSRTDIVGRFTGVFTVSPAGGDALRISECREQNRDIAWSPDGTQLAFLSTYYSTGGGGGICIAEADGSEAHDLFVEYEIVTSGPTWSADGEQIAGVWLQLDDETGEFLSELFVSNVDGSDASAIVADGLGGSEQDRQPVWSPDGESIAWVSQRNGNSDVFVTDVLGLDWYALTDSAAFDGDPVWRPEQSRQILFSSNRDGNDEIYLMNGDGTNQRNLTRNPGSDYDAVWSPDGDWIAFSSDRDGDADIYAMDAYGANLIQLTHNDAWDGRPAWSPDGEQLSIGSEIDGVTRIWVIDRGGNGGHAVSPDDANAAESAWAPDGSTIAYTSYGPFGAPISFVHPDGSDNHMIEDCFGAGLDSGLTWSPDGAYLAFTSALFPPGKYQTVCVAHADGSDAHGLFSFEFGAGGVRWSPDSTMLAFFTGVGHPSPFNSDIYTVGLTEEGINNLTHEPGGDFDESSDWDPAWSSDGATIVFTTDRDGDNEIYVVRSGEPYNDPGTNLTNSPGEDGSAEWRP